MGLLFVVRPFHYDGELGAHPHAHIAAGALFNVGHGDKLVALFVRFIRLIENVLRAKLHAKRAAFAAWPDDTDTVMLRPGGHVR